MNPFRLICILTLVLISMVVGVSCGHGDNNQRSTSEDFTSSQARVPGEYLVTVIDGGGDEVIRNLYGRFGIQDMKQIGNNIFLVTLSEDPGQAKMEELNAQEPRIEAVQSNLVYQTGPKLK